MNTARHVKKMLATGTIKDGETTMRVVCSVCDVVITEGRTINGHSSHGLCPRHYRMQMAEIAVRAVSKYGTALGRHDRQSDEVVQALDRVHEAIYSIVDVPSEETGAR